MKSKIFKIVPSAFALTLAMIVSLAFNSNEHVTIGEYEEINLTTQEIQCYEVRGLTNDCEFSGFIQCTQSILGIDKEVFKLNSFCTLQLFKSEE